MSIEEYALDAMFRERQAAMERAAELHGRSTNIVQNMIVIIGSGALAATQEPGAFVIAPIMWSVWVLYAEQTDRDTIKWNLYGDWLATRHDQYLNDLGGRTLNSPRGELFSVQGGRTERLLYVFPGLYIFGMQVLLSVIAFVLLRDDGRHELSWAFLATMLIVTTVFSAIAFNRARVVRQYEQVLKSYS